MTDTPAIDWRRVEAIFHEAAALPPERRERTIADRCGNDDALRAAVATLLDASDGAERFLSSSVPQAFAACERTESEAGPWRLGRQLGHGGMGVVYAAERAGDGFVQVAAVKLLRDRVAGPELVRRFHRERMILASLDHPCIARLIDGGLSSKGQPYLAMELVDGEPITEHCDRNALSVEARVALFEQVCDAVAHAHARLVVHRDLKPRNILVDVSGRPRLLDFGIASMLDDCMPGAVTATSERRCTPAYASPEQVRGGPVTTTTDVHALGVVLHELLVGALPDGARDEDGVVAHHEPPSRRLAGLAAGELDVESIARCRATDPGRLRRALAGDLGTIVLAALHPDPSRRYASVEALRRDLSRWRMGLPIGARPDGWRYRTRLFLRRHRLGASAASLAALGLLAGTVLATWQARVAERRRAEAEAALATHDASWRFLRSILVSPDPREGGSGMSVRDALDRASARIGIELADAPAVEARVREAVGSTQRTLGDLGAAELQLVLAADLATSAFGIAAPETASAVHELALLRLDQGRFDEALPLIERAVRIRLERFGPQDSATLESRTLLGLVDLQLDRPQEALEEFDLIVAARRATLGAEHPQTLVAQKHRSTALRQLGRHEAAQAVLESVYANQSAALGEQHPDTLITANEIGTVLRVAGSAADAVPWFERALAGLERQFPAGSIDVVIPRCNLARALAAAGRLDESIALCRQALDDGTPVLGSEHYLIAVLQGDLGASLLERGETDEARALLETAHRTLDRSLGPAHRLTLQVAAALARAARDDP